MWSFTHPSSVYTILSPEAAIPFISRSGSLLIIPRPAQVVSSSVSFMSFWAVLSSFDLLTPKTSLGCFHDSTCSFLHAKKCFIEYLLLCYWTLLKQLTLYLGISPARLQAIAEQELCLMYSLTPDSNLAVGIWERQVYWRKGWIDWWMVRRMDEWINKWGVDK